MPHRSNDRIAEIVVNQGWFNSQTKEGLLSDNWRIVEDSEGRKAILYIVRFLSTSKSGEPKRIPNEPTALGKLVELNRGIPSPKCGPFIALAEESHSEITHIRLWDISSKISGSKDKFEVAELGHVFREHK